MMPDTLYFGRCVDCYRMGKEGCGQPVGDPVWGPKPDAWHYCRDYVGRADANDVWHWPANQSVESWITVASAVAIP